MSAQMRFSLHQRRAGILLHPSSLPSGTVADAPRWLNMMQQAGLTVWQMLPLGVPQTGLSPYLTISAFALNPQLFPVAEAPQPNDSAFLHFCQQQAHWLDDFAQFTLLRHQLDNQPWYRWPIEFRDRDPATLATFNQQYITELNEIRWLQYHCYQSWQQIRSEAATRNIALFGDMPIFVAHDSADVWAQPHNFLLNAEGLPTQVTGVPPDYFSETGQRWGNPHYNWQQMEQSGFDWWLARLHFSFQLYDLVRIDHFRGLEAVWEIPAEDETAMGGHWQPVPGDRLLEVLHQEMGELPLVAEDLGLITPEVRALKARFELPGMSVLQFSFDHFEDNPHKPHNIVPHTVVYTGTHDNNTTLGWYRELDPATQHHVCGVLGLPPERHDEYEVLEAMIQAALTSKANLAIIPFQDLLALGAESRMNIPGTTEGNWSWRFTWDEIEHCDLKRRLHTTIETTQRDMAAHT